MLTKIVESFLNIFESSDMGELSWYLGVDIEVGSGTLKMSQRVYIEELAQEYEVPKNRAVYTPMTSNFFDELEENKKMPIIAND